jgi:hypothetical protein
MFDINYFFILAKTSAMFVGELEFSDLPINRQVKNFETVITHKNPNCGSK